MIIQYAPIKANYLYDLMDEVHNAGSRESILGKITSAVYAAGEFFLSVLVDTVPVHHYNEIINEAGGGYYYGNHQAGAKRFS